MNTAVTTTTTTTNVYSQQLETFRVPRCKERMVAHFGKDNAFPASVRNLIELRWVLYSYNVGVYLF